MQTLTVPLAVVSVAVMHGGGVGWGKRLWGAGSAAVEVGRRAGSSSDRATVGGTQAYSQGIGRPRGNFWKVLVESWRGIQGKNG